MAVFRSLAPALSTTLRSCERRAERIVVDGSRARSRGTWANRGDGAVFAHKSFRNVNLSVLLITGHHISPIEPAHATLLSVLWISLRRLKRSA